MWIDPSGLGDIDDDARWCQNDALWDYGDGQSSERRFREALEAACEGGDNALIAELNSQLARSLLCQGRFEEARKTLDEATQLLKDVPRISRVRAVCILER